MWLFVVTVPLTMAETDHPLKQLVAAFKQDFASLRRNIFRTALRAKNLSRLLQEFQQNH
jgi:hypothetical protein